MPKVKNVTFDFDKTGNISLSYDVIADDGCLSKWHSTAPSAHIEEKTQKFKNLKERGKSGDALRR